MKLEIGRVYKDGNGKTVHIDGPTRLYPEQYAYSRQGNWYDYEGRYVIIERAGKRLTQESSPRNIDFSKGSISVEEDDQEQNAKMERALAQAEKL